MKHFNASTVFDSVSSHIINQTNQLIICPLSVLVVQATIWVEFHYLVVFGYRSESASVSCTVATVKVYFILTLSLMVVGFGRSTNEQMHLNFHLVSN